MAGGRAAVAMTDAETDAFLRAQRKVQVATNGHDGTPHLTTLFYVVDEAGRIMFWTYGRSQKIKNLERDARVTALVEGGDDYFELRGVSIRGRAEVITDPQRIFEIGAAVATRMVDAESFESLGDLGRTEVERQARKRVAIVIHPERVATWDHAKMLNPGGTS